MLACVYAIILFGGASRIDVLAQIVPQLAGLAMVVTGLWMWQSPEPRFRLARYILAAFAALIAIQLVPLPPSIWTALPGRAFLADAAKLSGIEQPWRPISISPDTTVAALLGLLPSAGLILIWPRLDKVGAQSVLPHLIILALLSAILGVLQLASGTDSAFRFYEVTNTESAVGLFANRNHHALFMASALPMLVHWVAKTANGRRAQIWRFAGMIGALFLLCSIIVAGSRLGLILGVVGIVYFAVMLPVPTALTPLRSQPRSTWQVRIVTRLRVLSRFTFPVAAISITGAAIFLARATSVDRLVGRDVTADLRGKVVEPVFIAGKDLFPFGSGFGTFDRAFRIFEPSALLSNTYWNHAHNDFLEVFLEGGVLAIILCSAFLVFWFLRSFDVWFRGDATRSATKLAKAGSSVTAAILVASMFDYPLRTPAIAVLFTIACLWLLDAGQPAVKRGEK